MEILFAPPLEKERKYTAHCDCGAVFKFGAIEAEQTYFTSGRKDSLNIRCPICSKMNYIDPDLYDKVGNKR